MGEILTEESKLEVPNQSISNKIGQCCQIIQIVTSAETMTGYPWIHIDKITEIYNRFYSKTWGSLDSNDLQNILSGSLFLFALKTEQMQGDVFPKILWVCRKFKYSTELPIFQER